MSSAPEDETREVLVEGRMVYLTPALESDFELAEEWLNPESKTASLAAPTNTSLSADAMRKLRDQGGAVFYTIMADPLGPVGLAHYRIGPSPGYFALSGAVGPPELLSRGFGTEAFWLLIHRLFTVERAERIELTIGMHNSPMIKVMTNSKLFVLEGIKRRSMLVKGRWYDQSIWSMVREEFEKFFGENAPASAGGDGDYPDADPELDEHLGVSVKEIRRYFSQSPWTPFSSYTEDAEASTL